MLKAPIKRILFNLSGGYQPEKFWDAWAPTFMEDSWQRKIHPQHQYLLHKITQTDPKTILEIGCGFGRNIKYLIKKGIEPKKITGVDISKKMIEMAKKYVANKDVRYIIADITHLPFKDNSFEFVFLHGVFMHVPPKKIKQAIVEVLRVTQKELLFIEQDYKPEKDNPYTFIHDYSAFLPTNQFKKVEYRRYQDQGVAFWYVKVR